VNERRKRTRLMSQINVVPYIDVMLVLLVIFMVTAPLINTSMVDLPSVSRSNQPTANPLEVLIRKDGSIELIDRERGGEKKRVVNRDALVGQVKAMIARNKDQPVVIAADQDVQYKVVVEVMDVLQSNGVVKVGLLTKPRSG
jgi:biopolymer transport protein TolR